MASLVGIVWSISLLFIGYRLGFAKGELVGENRILPMLKEARLEHLKDLAEMGARGDTLASQLNSLRDHFGGYSNKEN